MGLRDIWKRVEARFWMLKDPALKDVYQGWAGGSTSSGIVVNERAALSYSAVWAAVSTISSSVASLPLIVYKRKTNGRDRAPGRNLWKIVHEEPNPEMTPFVFFETVAANLLLNGNAYCEIERSNDGRVRALWPIPPQEVAIKRRDDNGAIYYEITRGEFSQRKKVLPSERVLHFVGLSSDGLVGYSPISQAKETIALGIATEKFGATFFGNGAWPGAVATHPEKLSAEAQERLRASWNALHKGPDKAHKLAILEEGMKLEKMGMSNNDSQFLATREFQVEEVARWYHLPPHKIQHKYSERPGGSIEAQNVEYVTDCLRPWLIRIEQEVNRKLIPERDKGKFYTEFLVDALLRGDTEARYRTYEIGKKNGWLSVNEIRRLENMNPVKGGSKHEGTGAPVAAAPPPPPPGEEPPKDDEPEPKPEQKAHVLREVFVDTMSRLCRAEANAVRKAAKKPATFDDWAREFYGKHQEKLRAAFLPAIRAAMMLRDPSQDPERIAAEWAEDQVTSSLQQLASIQGVGFEESVDVLADTWESERPAETADAFTGEPDE
jgi:HK97 family phage portal protein